MKTYLLFLSIGFSLLLSSCNKENIFPNKTAPPKLIKTSTYTDKPEEARTLISSTTYLYNDKQLLVGKEVITDADPTHIRHYKYEYDNDNRLIKEGSLNEGVWSSFYVYEYESDSKYKSSATHYSKEDANAGSHTDYVYDENGQLQATTLYTFGYFQTDSLKMKKGLPLFGKTEYHYKTNGQLYLEASKTSYSTERIDRHVYIYDDSNRLEEEYHNDFLMQFYTYEENGVVSTYSPSQQLLKESQYSNRQLVNEKVFYGVGNERVTRETVYEYE